MLDINLLRPEKGGDPVRFVATTFIPLSLLVVFVDVFLCSSSFRRRLRRAMIDDWRRFLMKKRRHGFLFISFLLALSLSDIKD